MSGPAGARGDAAAGGRAGRGAPLAGLVMVLGLASACRASPAVTSDVALRPDEARAGRAAEGALEREGRRLYAEHCVGCHGEKGDGQGPAARFLDPKPRDFTTGLFKFASVPAGDLPRDEDLMRVLSRGLPGSSMPSWQLLPDSSRRALVAYLKDFAPVFAQRPAGSPVALSPDPFAGADRDTLRQGIDRGRFVYHVLATCWQCHRAYAAQEEIKAMAAASGEAPPELRPDFDRPVAVDDAWGGTILAPDFTRARLKGGSSPADLYRAIAAGVGGTAMPTWKDGLEERDLWALVYYVKSLADCRWRSASAAAGSAGR